MAMWVACSPSLAFADDSAAPAVAPDPSAATAPVIITEVLTGTKTSGSQEFIELYNTTDEPIDLTGWQLWYLSAQAADPNKPASSGVIALGDNASTSVIAAHGYYVLSGRADYLAGVAQQFYTGTMAATGGNLRLLSPDADNPCVLDLQDQIAWGNGLYPQGLAVAAPPTGQSAGRLTYADGSYADTHNNVADFAIGTPTPGQSNSGTVLSSSAAAAPVLQPQPMFVPISGCTTPMPIGSGGDDSLQSPGDDDAPPATVVTQTQPAGSSAPAAPMFPAADDGLVMPQLTELLPNPAPPATDANDEFIELYNSNGVAFDLSGFVLRVGLTATHRYTFPLGTSIPPKTFAAFFSSQTGLSMSNSGGQAAFLDPFGKVLMQTDVYGTAKDGLAWALANGVWQWSTTPTPNAPNVVTGIVASSKKSAATNSNKTTATKTTAAKKPKAAKSKALSATGTTTGDAAPSATIHPAVLAGVAGFALLYGLYEYRQDMANKLYQFRANRTARRAARAEIEGG